MRVAAYVPQLRGRPQPVTRVSGRIAYDPRLPIERAPLDADPEFDMEVNRL